MYDVLPITTPHATACGPACLKMLLAYYGQDVPIETLIEECHVGTAGCTARDVTDAGRAHGLDMRSWSMPAADALTMDRPAILWWRFTHFVVFCGLNEKGEPVICNPSSGRFPISREVFARAFSGVALTQGEVGDYVPRVDGNYAPGEIFRAERETWIALRPITRGEKLAEGWNAQKFDILAALNAAQKKEEE